MGIKSTFLESLKNIEDDQTRLLKLQKKYRTGEIKEEQLTEDEVKQLSDLYDKQISELKRINEKRKKKLLAYRKRCNIK